MSGRAATLFIAFILALDQYTKHLIVRGWELGESLPVIPGFFSLTYVRNRGAAFGMFSELPETWRVTFFVVFALLTVAALIWMFASTPRSERAQRLAIASVIGGAAGNLYDRVLHGEVVDFLDVFVGNWHWPAFNVADSFISCGVVLLLLSSFRGSGKGSEAPEVREPSAP